MPSQSETNLGWTALPRLIPDPTMPSLDGITVRILCGEEALEEFSTLVDPEDSSTISCWIPSRADEIFSICYEFKKKTPFGTSCAFSCDGVKMRRSVVPSKSKSYRHNNARDGNYLRPMMFTEMLQTDSQDAAETPVNPELGMIEVGIWRMRPGSRPIRRKGAGKAIPINIDESAIHESKKMLGVHRIRLGQGTSSPFESKVLSQELFQVFKFYYRPMAVLQAMGHAPIASGQPGNSEDGFALKNEDTSSESDPDGEEEEITAKMHILQQRRDKIRMEREEKRSKTAPRNSKGFKQEERMIVVPPSAMEEIIDLSSD